MTEIPTTTTELDAPVYHGTSSAPAPAPMVGHRRVPALLLIALAVLALWASACDVPGPVVGTGTKDGVAKVLGTNGSDAITLRLQAGNPDVIEVDVGADGTADFQLERPLVQEIIVKGFGGDDAIRVDHSNGAFTDTVPTQLLGGEGADTLVGSTGAEVLSGGAGDDFLDGNQGADSLAGDAGADVFQWDPGDGNEVASGGTEADRLVFNGSGAGEIIDVSAIAGGHVRLARNVANIVMDLDDIESVDVRTLGGTDIVNAADLTGTDLTTLNADLAGSGGADDAQVDQLVVAPGPTIGRDGAAATVDGLGAQVRALNGGAGDSIHVTGTAGADVVPVAGTPGVDVVSATADGTDVVVSGATPGVFVRLTAVETLDVDLGGGPDQFAATGNLAPLLAMQVAGGDDADTLLGGNGADLLSGGPGADFLDGNQGADTAVGDAGVDVFQWDPGDGNDVLAGGSEADQLLFNGSGANEIIDVSSAGAGHVRVARNVGNIVMDLDDIETADVRTLGGVDIASVADLTGTDLTVLNADVAGIGGIDDAQSDEVAVAPGLVIGRDGPAATVDGLGAQVRVLNGGAGDSIHVTGTAGADVVPVVGTPTADAVSATAAGTDVVVSGATPGVFVRLTAVETLDVDLAGGPDQFAATGNLAALIAMDVNGGDDADTLLGGNGADALSGGPGADFLDGNQGADTSTGDAGVDVFQWDPGDGNDVLVGGTEADRLMFNGSGAGEIIDVSPVAGGHVRLTRNIGAIVMDLDEIETMDVRALGGADTVGVADLTGTDLAAVNADLAAVGGIDDGQIDQVVVNGTAGDDQLGVFDEGSAVVVEGLTAGIRITGAGPTLDRLTVNGLAGNDTITATPGTAALILLDLLP
jgi:Ca2+-binding RTX toxin-like protein